MTKILKIMCVFGLMATSMIQSMDVFYHISQGNYKQVRQWLKSEACNVSTTDSQGDTILHAAVRAEDVDMLNIILSTKVNVNTVNNAGQSALDLAVELGNKDIVMALVSKKAGVTTVNKQKEVGKLCKNNDETEGKFISKLVLTLGVVICALLLGLLLITDALLPVLIFTPVVATGCVFSCGMIHYTNYRFDPWYYPSYSRSFWWAPSYRSYYVADPVFYYY